MYKAIFNNSILKFFQYYIFLALFPYSKFHSQTLSLLTLNSNSNSKPYEYPVILELCVFITVFLLWSVWNRE